MFGQRAKKENYLYSRPVDIFVHCFQEGNHGWEANCKCTAEPPNLSKCLLMRLFSCAGSAVLPPLEDHAIHLSTPKSRLQPTHHECTDCLPELSHHNPRCSFHHLSKFRPVDVRSRCMLSYAIPSPTSFITASFSLKNFCSPICREETDCRELLAIHNYRRLLNLLHHFLPSFDSIHSHSVQASHSHLGTKFCLARLFLLMACITIVWGWINDR